MIKPEIIMSGRAQKYIATITAFGAIAGAAQMTSDHESNRNTAYYDTGGILTVCRGVTGKEVIKGKYYSDAECEVLNAKHLKIAVAAVERNVTVPINPFIKAALIDWTYNLGEGNLKSSTLLKKLNAKDYEYACYQLIRWDKGKVKGVLQVLKGLFIRRNDEMAVCTHGMVIK